MSGNDVIQVVGRGSNVDFTIDDSVPFEEVIQGLRAYLRDNRTLYSRGKVSVNVGRRLVSADEMDQIKQTMEQGWGFNVTRYWCPPEVLNAALSESPVGSKELEALTSPARAPNHLRAGGGISEGWEGPESARFVEAAYLAQLKVEEANEKGQTNGPTRQHRLPDSEAPAPPGLLSSGRDRGGIAEARSGDALLVKTTCRSGEEIRHNGDVIILADVNPGAEIIASGDIIVLGTLRGLAHAGAGGDHGAAIIALSLQAPRLQIGLYIGTASQSVRESKSSGTVPKIAYVRQRSIYIDRYVGRFAGYNGGTLYGG
jgi:septum site-determining protein MinC